MAMAALASTYNPNLSQTLPFEQNKSSLRDVSFLGSAEENHARKFSDTSRVLSPKIIINRDNENHYSGMKKEEDGEIGIFRAEKYFNGGIDMDIPRINKTDSKKFEYVNDGGANLEPVKSLTHQGTPSVRSESSWNSQSALLQCVMRNPPKVKPGKVNGKSFFSGLFACKCYCSDRNSVDIEEAQVGEISFKRPVNGEVVHKANLNQVNKPSAEPRVKEELFTFPTMNSTMGIQPLKVPLQREVDEIGRKSLEVFGSPVLRRRRLKMLPWKTSPKAEETENSSDASSDLFEIESITGKTNNPFLGRQASSDAASGCFTPTTCYAPSEASIEWSVVTAGAADFSVMSDYEDLRPTKRTFPTTTNGKTKNNKELQGRRSGGLLGCNSQKAVKVAGDARRTNEKASSMAVTRFLAERTKQTPWILATRSLPHSHPPPASNILYIQ